MKGLILKDLYIIRSFGKQYGIAMACMAVWAVFIKQVSVLYLYTIVMGSMLILSTFSWEEAVSFNRLALTMPVSGRMLVREKYLLFLLTMGTELLLALGLNLLLPLINILMMLLNFQMFENFEWREVLPVLTVFVIGMAITLPVVCWKGAEKGRYAYMAAMLGTGALIYIVVKIQDKLNFSFTLLETMPGMLYVGFFAAICFAVLGVSYLVSVRLTKNKEW